jgi:SHS2 domain-containing protein
MPAEPFEIVEHTADWAIRVTAPDLAALFTYAAQGMNSLLVSQGETIPLDIEREIVLEAYDAESLLVDWLGELVYWAEMEQVVMHEFDLQHISPTSLRAKVRGGRAFELEKHIKAVTYHNLAIEDTSDGLQVTLVFDV